jgi:hypothetical protein
MTDLPPKVRLSSKFVARDWWYRSFGEEREAAPYASTRVLSEPAPDEDNRQQNQSCGPGKAHDRAE